MEIFTEYKIKIVNKNKDSASQATLFGANTFMMATNYGSGKGIDIEVTKDGKYIKYTELLNLSNVQPFKVIKTQIVSSPNQASQKFTHSQQDISGMTTTKPFFPVKQNDYLYEIDSPFLISGDSHLTIPVLNNAVLVMILNIENNKIKR